MSDSDARVGTILDEADGKISSSDDLVQICWLIDGLALHYRTNGSMGHSLEDTKRYVISSILNSGKWEADK